MKQAPVTEREMTSLPLDANPILCFLLHAFFFPKSLAITPHKPFRLMMEERLDALHNHAVPLADLYYAWALHRRIVPIRSILYPTTTHNFVGEKPFYKALASIASSIGLECSFPVPSTMDIEDKLKMAAWPEQRVRIYERSIFTPTTINIGPRKDGMYCTVGHKKLLTCMRFGQAIWSDSTSPDSFGEPWLRVSRLARESFAHDMYSTLKLMEGLERDRVDALRKAYSRHKTSFSKADREQLEEHLSYAWADLLATIPNTIDQQVEKLPAKRRSLVTPELLAKTANDSYTELVNIAFPKPATPKKQIPIKAFISYSQKDGLWCNEVRKHLAPALKNETIDVWYDGNIQSGKLWRKQIEQAMKNAKIGILLVSPNFLSSDFITNEELPFLLRAAKRNRIQLFTVYVTACDFTSTPLKDIQAANDPAKPLRRFSGYKRDAALVEITKKIIACANTLASMMSSV